MVFAAAGAGGVTNCGRNSVLQGFVGRHAMSSCAGMSWRLRGGAALVCAFLVITACGRPAGAETLEQALTDAYLINPVLNAERARLRATDEQVALAKSGLRPFISASGDTAFMNTSREVSTPRNANVLSTAIGSSRFPEGTSHPRGWSVQLT